MAVCCSFARVPLKSCDGACAANAVPRSTEPTVGQKLRVEGLTNAAELKSARYE
jgi:hypothetical protein